MAILGHSDFKIKIRYEKQLMIEKIFALLGCVTLVPGWCKFFTQLYKQPSPIKSRKFYADRVNSILRLPRARYITHPSRRFIGQPCIGKFKIHLERLSTVIGQFGLTNIYKILPQINHFTLIILGT